MILVMIIMSSNGDDNDEDGFVKRRRASGGPAGQMSRAGSTGLSLSYPLNFKAVAEDLDIILWEMLEHTTNLHIPRVDEGLVVKCLLELPTGLQGRSFQDLLVRQPVKLGAGLRFVFLG